MNIFLDENMPRAVTDLLCSRGCRVHDVRGTGKEGMSDEDIFQCAIKSNAVFFTTDKDFFHTVRFLYETHPGIVVIALSQPNSRSITSKVKWFLDTYGTQEECTDRCFLISEKSCRIYSR